MQIGQKFVIKSKTDYGWINRFAIKRLSEDSYMLWLNNGAKKACSMLVSRDDIETLLTTLQEPFNN